MLSYRDVAVALCRASGVHEGHWRVALTFGQVAAVNATLPGGQVVPAAFLPVMRISLVQDDEPNPLTVDAAVVNPSSLIQMVN